MKSESPVPIQQGDSKGMDMSPSWSRRTITILLLEQQYQTAPLVSVGKAYSKHETIGHGYFFLFFIQKIPNKKPQA